MLKNPENKKSSKEDGMRYCLGLMRYNGLPKLPASRREKQQLPRRTGESTEGWWEGWSIDAHDEFFSLFGVWKSSTVRAI